jgi:hypothetical protein
MGGTYHGGVGGISIFIATQWAKKKRVEKLRFSQFLYGSLMSPYEKHIKKFSFFFGFVPFGFYIFFGLVLEDLFTRSSPRRPPYPPSC